MAANLLLFESFGAGVSVALEVIGLVYYLINELKSNPPAAGLLATLAASEPSPDPSRPSPNKVEVETDGASSKRVPF